MHEGIPERNIAEAWRIEALGILKLWTGEEKLADARHYMRKRYTDKLPPSSCGSSARLTDQVRLIASLVGIFSRNPFSISSGQGQCVRLPSVASNAMWLSRAQGYHAQSTVPRSEKEAVVARLPVTRLSKRTRSRRGGRSIMYGSENNGKAHARGRIMAK